MRESNKFNFLGGAVIPQPDMPRDIYAPMSSIKPEDMTPEQLIQLMYDHATNAERVRLWPEHRAAPSLEQYWRDHAAKAFQGAVAQSANPMDPQGQTDFATEALARALESPSIPQHPAYMAPRGKK